jgi:hypothetical protein
MVRGFPDRFRPFLPLFKALPRPPSGQLPLLSYLRLISYIFFLFLPLLGHRLYSVFTHVIFQVIRAVSQACYGAIDLARGCSFTSLIVQGTYCFAYLLPYIKISLDALFHDINIISGGSTLSQFPY